MTSDSWPYFFSTGFKPGNSYELTASATPQDGKPLSGSVQTKVPNALLTIHLRDDLPPPAGTFPPAPKPADKVNDYIPPMGYAPINQPKPPGDAWSPRGPTDAVPPTSIGGAKPPVTGAPPQTRGLHLQTRRYRHRGPLNRIPSYSS